MKMRKLVGPGRIRSYIGPVAEEEIQCRVACRKIPSEAWQAAHPVGEPTDPPGDEDMVIQVVVLGSYGYPSRLNHPANWPRGHFPVAELSVTPYLDWKKAGDIDIARQKGEDVSEPPTDTGTLVDTSSFETSKQEAKEEVSPPENLSEEGCKRWEAGERDTGTAALPEAGETP